MKIPSSFSHLFQRVLLGTALTKAFKLSTIENMNMNEFVWEDKLHCSKALGKSNLKHKVCQLGPNVLAMNYSNTWIHCASEIWSTKGDPPRQGQEMSQVGCWALNLCSELFVIKSLVRFLKMSKNVTSIFYLKTIPASRQATKRKRLSKSEYYYLV